MIKISQQFQGTVVPVKSNPLQNAVRQTSTKDTFTVSAAKPLSRVQFTGSSPTMWGLTELLKKNQFKEAQREIVDINPAHLNDPLYEDSLCTALDILVKSKNYKAVNALLMYGAELGEFKAPSNELLKSLATKGLEYPGLLKPALIFAAEENLGKMLDVLMYGNSRINLDERGPQNETALIAALGTRNNEIVQKLLSFKEPVTGQKILPNLEAKVPLDWNPLFQTEPTPLIMAVIQGNVEAAQWLLEAGANTEAVDNLGMSALAYAVKESDEKNAKALLNAGASISLTLKNNMPLITYAVSQNNREMVSLLLNAGASVNEPFFTEHSKTPLMIASESGYNKVAALLISKTNAVDTQDDRGRTALHYAIENQKPHLIAMLLEAGADPSVPDKRGIRPWDLAIEKGPSVINVLAEPEKFLP